MTKCYSKYCPKCSSHATKKDWFRRWRQSYKCVNCKYVWINQKRVVKSHKILSEQLYIQYARHKQTYNELSIMSGLSKKAVQIKLDAFEFITEYLWPVKSVILVIDTTYFWRNFWVMVFIDFEKNTPIHYEIVSYETNTAYKQWIENLQQKWWIIKAIVSDWRRWLLWGFWNIPTQMCHFHQSQIVRRNITKNPKLKEHKELKSIVDWLPRTDKLTFTHELHRRYCKNKAFIDEKYLNNKGKQVFKHKKLRTAYNSLKRNIPYLFVYLDHFYLNIPNTSNWAEWFFSHFKYKVNLHRWLAQKRKLKLIKFLLLYPK